MRQTFVVGHYALVDYNLEPNPVSNSLIDEPANDSQYTIIKRNIAIIKRNIALGTLTLLLDSAGKCSLFLL